MHLNAYPTKLRSLLSGPFTNDVTKIGGGWLCTSSTQEKLVQFIKAPIKRDPQNKNWNDEHQYEPRYQNLKDLCVISIRPVFLNLLELGEHLLKIYNKNWNLEKSSNYSPKIWFLGNTCSTWSSGWNHCNWQNQDETRVCFVSKTAAKSKQTNKVWLKVVNENITSIE